MWQCLPLTTCSLELIDSGSAPLSFPLSPPQKHLDLSLPKGRTASLFSASEEVIAYPDANTHHKLLFLVNSTSA